MLFPIPILILVLILVLIPLLIPILISSALDSITLLTLRIYKPYYLPRYGVSRGRVRIPQGVTARMGVTEGAGQML